MIKNYDDLVSPVPTSVPGGEIRDGKEPRNVVMRLLCSTHSNTLTDPRVQTRGMYPRPVPQLVTTCVGQDGWRLFTWSAGGDKVTLKENETNPYISK